jgi:predicted Rossmann-fold nucleotide-binding protein
VRNPDLGLLGIHDKPIVLINVAGYWDAFLGMLAAAVAAGFLRPARRELPLVAPDANAACDTLARLWLKSAKLYSADIRP